MNRKEWLKTHLRHQPAQPDVLVEVRGGVAYVSVRKGATIRVEYIDYDNEPEHAEPDRTGYEEAA